MLDIKFIRENTERVKQNTLDKGYKNVDIDRVIELDQERKALGQEIDSLRSRRNEIANSMKIAKSKPSSELIAEGKELKEKISALEDKYRHIDQDFMTVLKSIPNILQDDVPIGEEGEDEVVK